VTAQQETTQEPRFISDMSMASRCILSSVHTALRFPVPDLRTSRPPGPMLLLLDFLRPAPIPPALPMSMVAFSFSDAFRDGDRPPPPMDFRVLRVAGNVTSPWDDIVVKCDCSPKTIKTVCCFLSSRKKVLWNYINATGTCTLKDAPGRGRATGRIRDACISRGAISLARAYKSKQMQAPLFLLCRLCQEPWRRCGWVLALWGRHLPLGWRVWQAGGHKCGLHTIPHFFDSSPKKSFPISKIREPRNSTFNHHRLSRQQHILGETTRPTRWLPN